MHYYKKMQQFPRTCLLQRPGEIQ